MAPLYSISQVTIETESITLKVEFITCAKVFSVIIALAITNSIFLNKSQAIINTILLNILTSNIQAAIIGAGSVLVASLLLYRGDL
jgi:hypothetical protein